MAGYRSPKIRPDLIDPLTRLQLGASQLRDMFGITFSDLDYEVIGKPTSLDLSDLQYVDVITEPDPQRQEALVQLLCDEADRVADMTALVRNPQPPAKSWSFWRRPTP